MKTELHISRCIKKKKMLEDYQERSMTSSKDEFCNLRKQLKKLPGENIF